VRAVGPVRARELVLTGRLLAGRDAAAIGLVNEVAADEPDLDAKAKALAALLAAHPPAAVGQAKQLVLESAEIDARTSFQLEGTVQQTLLNQGLADNFPRAVKWIQEEVKRVRASAGR
jgi:enoyl-CoA hydratase/carnithine racemase